MLQLTIPAEEKWDEVKEEFVYSKEQVLQLEHSLLSLSKWESKWKKSFLFTKDKTYEEILDYIKCMTLTKNVNPDVYSRLTSANMSEIDRYINDPMTATTFREEKNTRGGREVVTAELIYYWMVALNIPFECQKWHLNRLFTLIRVCNIKNSPPKKYSTNDLARRNAKLNADRRKQLNTKG